MLLTPVQYLNITECLDVTLFAEVNRENANFRSDRQSGITTCFGQLSRRSVPKVSYFINNYRITHRSKANGRFISMKNSRERISGYNSFGRHPVADSGDVDCTRLLVHEAMTGR